MLKKIPTVGILTSLGFGLMGWVFIGFAHPHEDALILFKYAKNLAQTGAISYIVNGPPTEGATDFLYMVLIAAGGKLTIDPAISALIINTIGTFSLMMGYFCLIPAKAIKNQQGLWLTMIIFAFLVLNSPVVMASYVGFSVASYCGILIWIFVLLYKKEKLYLIPILGLLAGLWRPDGVIIGVSACVIGAYHIWVKQDNDAKAPFIATAILTFLIGCGYFMWRWHYFGHLLPLPLYVKKIYPDNFGEIFLFSLTILILAPAVIALRFIDRITPSDEVIHQYIRAIIPFVIFFVVITMSHQSQNVALRFQGPVFMVGLAAIPIASTKWHRWQMKGASAFFNAIIILTVAIMFTTVGGRFYFIRSFPTYLEKFHPKLSEILDAQDRIVLTEAGNIAYLGRAEYIDAVGLNLPYTAKNQVTVDWVSDQDAHMIMYHQIKTTILNDEFVKDDPVRPVPCEIFKFATKQNYKEVDPNFFKTKQAAIVLSNFLYEYREEYSCFVVSYYFEPFHFYAFKKDWPKKGNVIRAIKESHKIARDRISYLEMIKRY
jgi:hypothetical protein